VLELFRSNSLFSFLILLVYLVLIFLQSFISQPLTFNSGSDHAYLWKILSKLYNDSPKIGLIFQLLSIFIGGVFLSSITNKYKLSQNVTLFPPLFYILFSCLSLHFIWSGPIVIASTFMIIAIYYLLGLESNKEKPLNVFNIGLNTAIASLFFAPYFYGFILISIAFIMLQPLKTRSFLQMFLGFLCPYFISTIAILNGQSQLAENIQSLLLPFNFSIKWEMWNHKAWIVVSIYVLFILALLLNRGKLYYKRNVLIKRKLNILYLMLVLSLPLLLFQSRQNWPQIAIINPFLAILTGIMVSETKNKLIAELIHIFLLGTLLFLHFYLIY
jgi:hypothetical protein